MYQSPFSPNEIKYFMSLMQNDTTKGKGSTYAKVEVLLSSYKKCLRDHKRRLKNIKGRIVITVTQK